MRVLALTLCFAVLGLSGPTPTEEVTKLLAKLQMQIKAEGSVEQKIYDKFACWAEGVFARKTASIAQAKADIKSLSDNIKKCESESNRACTMAKQHDKDKKLNRQSVQEATSVRDNEHDSFLKERQSLENAINSLNKAIHALNGAGMGAGLISVARNVHSAMGVLGSSVSDEQMATLKQFVASPAEFYQSSAGRVEAYNSQSTEIQGILKNMYDESSRVLETNSREEAEAKAAFNQLKADKDNEYATLSTNFDIQDKLCKDKNQEKSEDRLTREETQEQLAADTKFLADTKKMSQAKSMEWAERTRLRQEELNGIEEAEKILQDGNKTLTEAENTFIQLSGPRNDAWKSLKRAASKVGSLRLAQIAASVQMGWHFNKVIAQIENMIQVLRDEEKNDLRDRDECSEQSQNQKATNEALDDEQDKISTSLSRSGAQVRKLNKNVRNLVQEKLDIEGDQALALSNRNGEHTKFVKALKADQQSVVVVSNAIKALMKFYNKNKKSLELLEVPTDGQGTNGEAPEAKTMTSDGPREGKYKIDEDIAPDSDFGGAKKRQSRSVISILQMIKEDLVNEIAKAREDEAQDKADYDQLTAENNAMLTAKSNRVMEAESEKASQMEKQEGLNGEKKDSDDEEIANSKAQAQTSKNCLWVETSFKSRMAKRKQEMQGLMQAKSFLGGAGAGKTAPTFLQMN